MELVVGNREVLTPTKSLYLDWRVRVEWSLAGKMLELFERPKFGLMLSERVDNWGEKFRQIMGLLGLNSSKVPALV